MLQREGIQLSGSYLERFAFAVEQLGDVFGHSVHQVLGRVPLDFKLTLLLVVDLHKSAKKSKEHPMLVHTQPDENNQDECKSTSGQIKDSHSLSPFLETPIRLIYANILIIDLRTSSNVTISHRSEEKYDLGHLLTQQDHRNWPFFPLIFNFPSNYILMFLCSWPTGVKPNVAFAVGAHSPQGLMFCVT